MATARYTIETLLASLMKMFRDKTIEKRVMAAITAASTRAQQAYDGARERLDAQHQTQFENLADKHEEEHNDLVEEHVSSVFKMLTK